MAGVATAELLACGAVAGIKLNHKAAPVVPPGVVQVSPDHVAAGARTKLSFTIRADRAGVTGGVAVITIPDGWSAPSTTSSEPGQITSSEGRVSVVGRSIHVTAIDLGPSRSLTVTYGGGGGGATEPTWEGRYGFAASVTAPHGSWNRPAHQVSLVSVVAPAYACQSLNGPAGVGQPLPLENGTVIPNLYNAYSSTGFLRQCSGPSGVTNSVSIKSLKPISYGPVGYPEVAYGNNLDDQPFCSGCEATPFPVPVSQLLSGTHDVRLTIDYLLGVPQPANLPRDLIFDLWLERAARAGSPPAEGDVELLVFLYQQNIATCLPTSSVATVTTPITSEGVSSSGTWKVCQIQGGTKATPLAFFLEQPAPSEGAHLSLALKDLVQGAATYLNQDLVDHAVMGVEVGGEFNQCSVSAGCVDPEAQWQWSLQELTITDGDRTIPVVFPEQQNPRG